MKLLDTVVLVGAVNPKDKHHEMARKHLDSLKSNPEVFIPTTTILEFDLELKAHGYTYNERQITFEDLLPKIPEEKILAITILSMVRTAEMEVQGLGYFDSLIVAQALNMDGEVITTDEEIKAHVKTSW